jgi:hypothetical protein
MLPLIYMKSAKIVISESILMYCLQLDFVQFCRYPIHIAALGTSTLPTLRATFKTLVML